MWTALLTPKWIGRLLGILGLVSVVSALSPALRPRLDIVTELLPSAFPALATTGALATGVLLVVLSRAVRRGKFRAWLVATVLTGTVMVLHVVKGLDLEEAALSAAMLGLLLAGRRNFTARADPRSFGQLAAALVVAPVVATLLGFLWLRLDAGSEAPGTSDGERVVQALLGLAGIPGPVVYVNPESGTNATVALLVLGAATVLTWLLIAMRPAGGPHPASEPEREQIRRLLETPGDTDSLGYFALRRDRCVALSRSGKAAVTYRVLGGVSLAAGDPVGDPEAWPAAIGTWLAEAREHGWSPAVLGASEKAAWAYQRAGLDALELGDEAIVDLGTFSLEGRAMRGVRQAVSRCTRAGITVTCHRVRDLDEPTRELLRHKADEWRDGEVERGFSMALDRFCSPEDGAALVVLARDADGDPRGLLCFVPWGASGLSLDLMRRDRTSENGLVEHMVAALCAEAPRLGVTRLSLNFAVLRSVFARGEQIGAGPVLRLWYAVLMGLSRFWQIESLYRANAKYQPEWRPRFLCFADAGDLPRIATAALRAEAFLVLPRWLSLPGRGDRGQPSQVRNARSS